MLVKAKEDPVQSRTESLCRNGLASFFESSQYGINCWHEITSSSCSHTILIITKNSQEIHFRVFSYMLVARKPGII